MTKSSIRPPQDEGACATAALLASGGDERTSIDLRTGRNRYGYQTRPDPEAVLWSSSTGSTPSWRAFRGACELRERLFAGGDLRLVHSRGIEAGQMIGATLLAQFGLDRGQGVDVVLTPSGTDAEFIPLLFLRGEGEAAVSNILVAEGELGSSTALAASARHCGDMAPSGARLARGAGIEGIAPGWVTVHSVRVRDEQGEPRAPDEVDRAVASQVEAALRRGQRVLLHLVDPSKTGIRAPSLALVESLARTARDRVRVVVDAAQGRVDERHLREYLARGFMVVLSGSKFYAGPCYCGAVLVPHSPWGTTGPRGAMPRGMQHYLARGCLPEHWPIHRSLDSPANVGLLLRWAAALAEIRAYRQVPAHARRAILTALGVAIADAASHSPFVEPVTMPALPLQTAHPGEDGLSTVPTIFTFKLRHHGPEGARDRLRLAMAQHLHRLMAEPLASRLRRADTKQRELADRRFLLGQPVELGPSAAAALRVAISAPQVTEIGAHAHDAAALERQLQAAAVELAALFGKLDILMTSGELAAS